MAILKLIIVSIMGIYLMVIGSGHLTTKNVMCELKGDGSHHEMRHDNYNKNQLILTTVNKRLTVWVISFNESAMYRGCI